MKMFLYLLEISEGFHCSLLNLNVNSQQILNIILPWFDAFIYMPGHMTDDIARHDDMTDDTWHSKGANVRPLKVPTLVRSKVTDEVW